MQITKHNQASYIHTCTYNMENVEEYKIPGKTTGQDFVLTTPSGESAIQQTTSN